jgi:surface antigen
MGKSFQRFGKLLPLHRVKVSHRKFLRRLTSTLVGVLLLFFSASQVSAAYAPSDLNEFIYLTGSSSPTPAAPAISRPTPEIKAEIKDALHVSSGSNFSYGQCTWYVASRRAIPWGGNAGTWFASAQYFGWHSGHTPVAGAIMVSFEGNSAGHVAYVEKVNTDGSFTVSEMNYNGHWGKINWRTLRLNDIYIVGFIY